MKPLRQPSHPSRFTGIGVFQFVKSMEFLGERIKRANPLLLALLTDGSISDEVCVGEEEGVQQVGLVESAPASAIISNILLFCTDERASPTMVQHLFRTVLDRRWYEQQKAKGRCIRLGIRSSLQMRELRVRLDDWEEGSTNVDDEPHFEEYVILDPPLACCHNKLVDPQALIASVRADYSHPRSRRGELGQAVGTDAMEKGIQQQFALDFPRLKMFVNGEKLDISLSAQQVQEKLTRTFVARGKGTVDERAAALELAKQVILLATQGTLAPVFQWTSKLCADRDNGVHVVSGGHQQVHLQTHGHGAPQGANKKSGAGRRGDRGSKGGGAAEVELFVMKPLQVISVEGGEAVPLTDLMCQLRLVLAPWTGGEMTLCVPHRHHTIRGSAVTSEAVSVEMPIAGKDASLPLMAMATSSDARAKAMLQKQASTSSRMGLVSPRNADSMHCSWVVL
jgi:hypothetical protein